MKDYDFVNLIRRNIYRAKVNAVIPWACIQTESWVGGDPNPGTAFFVDDVGNYQVKPQYYYYKQLTTAGHRDMAVAAVEVEIEDVDHPDIALIAFASNGTAYPDAFIVLNFSEIDKAVNLNVKGASMESFEATRSSATDKNIEAGNYTLESGKFIYEAPAGSVTTFFAK